MNNLTLIIIIAGVTIGPVSPADVIWLRDQGADVADVRLAPGVPY